MKNKNKTLAIGRTLIAGFLVMQIFFGYAGIGVVGLPEANVAHSQLIDGPLDPSKSKPINVPKYEGVDQSIKDFLCVPDDSNLGTALYDCVAKVYRFGIAFGAIALVFFIVLAGYYYIVGGESSKEKGKGIFTAALTGMAIILSSYVLLNFINPTLTKIRPIQAPIFEASILPKCEDVGFGATCVLPSGQVSSGGGGYTSGTASANLKQYEPIIVKYAQENKIEFCALNALLDLESSGIYNNVSNGPPNRVEPNHADKKFYGLPFTRAAAGSSIKGHGIGLGQVFIYGPPGNSGWADKSTPSRAGKEFGFSKPLTITDLIDPDTAIKAAAYHFAQVKLPHHNGNYANAYASSGKPSYHGAGKINGVDVNKIYQTKFNDCKTKSK